MLKAKADLEKYLEKQIMKIVTKNDLIDKVCVYAEHNYDFPYVKIMDYLTLRNPLMEANEFHLFCILDSIEKTTKEASDIYKSKIPEYFTESEIKNHSNTKLKEKKIKFPLRFKAVQITETQWITKIDFKTLMKFRAVQLINYDENQQRTMQRIVHGDTEYYRIKIDKDTVSNIEKSYLDGSYIPTPFTFNIPAESNAVFYYDEERSELIIKELEKFDITDGYHRYVAACKACDSNKLFNFTMELRITNFPDYKARHFIYQEDQKVKMTKSESNTYNQNSLANQVVEKLNDNPLSNIKGLISRNDGLIKYSDLAEMIQFYYLSKDSAKSKTSNQIVISVAKELMENFNILTESNEKYLEEKYNFKKLLIIMHCFSYFSNKNKKQMCEVIDKAIKKSTKLDPTLFTAKKPRNGLANEIQKLIEEVV